MEKLEKIIWKTEKRKVKELIAYDKNPRILSDFQKIKLKESLKKFGLVEIPAIDVDNRILAGHQRIKILLLLNRGEDEIDVRVPNRKLTKEEFTEYNLRSNISAGEWDVEALKNLDIELLMDVGFNNDDLSKIWDDNLEIYDDEFDTSKELEKIKVPRTKLGDVIKLGQHLLTCGDSTDINVVQRLTSEKLVSMAYFDPPYNISLDYNKGVGGKGKYGGKTNDNKTDLEYREFLKKTIQNGLVISKPDIHFFVWNDENHIGLIQDLYKDIGIENKRVCLWIKNGFSPTPSSAFNKCYEACIYGTIGKPSLSDNPKNLNEIMNKEIGSGNRTIDDILDILNIWLVKRLPGSEYGHPTEKSPTLHEKALRRCTKVGDTVLDLFGGAGSTLIACEQLRRKCLMVECEPIFCDLIISRYQKLTGKEVEYVN